MFDALKKWASGATPKERRRDALMDWARGQGASLREDPATGRLAGSVPSGERSWTVEWGPSQRAYVPGSELCLRSELPVPAVLQALVLDQALRAQMEREVFEAYVQDLHTRVDTRTPPEMRWLVMLPPLPPTASAALGQAYAGVASDGPWAARWVEGPVAQSLASVRTVRGEPQVPFVLMLSRGRLTLRTGLEAPEPVLLDALSTAFRAASEAAIASSAA